MALQVATSVTEMAGSDQDRQPRYRHLRGRGHRDRVVEIEEMARSGFPIVADNANELAVSAEETSSSINEMAASIEEVSAMTESLGVAGGQSPRGRIEEMSLNRLSQGRGERPPDPRKW